MKIKDITEGLNRSTGTPNPEPAYKTRRKERAAADKAAKEEEPYNPAEENPFKPGEEVSLSAANKNPLALHHALNQTQIDPNSETMQDLKKQGYNLDRKGNLVKGATGLGRLDPRNMFGGAKDVAKNIFGKDTDDNSQVQDLATRALALKQKQQQAQQQATSVMQPNPARAPVAPVISAYRNIPSGKKIAVQSPTTQGVYFKTKKGWSNEMGQTVTKRSSIDQLELLANQQKPKIQNI